MSSIEKILLADLILLSLYLTIDVICGPLVASTGGGIHQLQ